ncbi:MAG: hypothetical protein WKF47_18640 [Geodermatophilaceae bacterium]
MGSSKKSAKPAAEKVTHERSSDEHAPDEHAADMASARQALERVMAERETREQALRNVTSGARLGGKVSGRDQRRSAATRSAVSKSGDR